MTALSQMLFNDIFDDAGYSLIVTKEGEIIAYDGEPSYHKITYGDNFFDFYKAMLPVKDINHCKKAMNLPIVLRKSLTK